MMKTEERLRSRGPRLGSLAFLCTLAAGCGGLDRSEGGSPEAFGESERPLGILYPVGPTRLLGERKSSRMSQVSAALQLFGIATIGSVGGEAPCRGRGPCPPRHYKTLGQVAGLLRPPLPQAGHPGR
jgi:hypothetical protein